MIRRKMRLGDILVSEGLLSKENLEKALAEQKNTGGRLGNTLIKMGMIGEDQLFDVLSDQFGIPYVDIATMQIDPKVPKIIPESLAKKHKLIPIKIDGNILTIAMEDPLDIIAQDDIRLVTGLEISVVISSSRDILSAVNRYYDTSDQAKSAIEDFNAQKMDFVHEEKVEDASVSTAPIVRLVNTIILQAYKSKASDIHIEPYEYHFRVRMRIDGELRELMSQEIAMHSALVTRIKIMSKLNISEKRVPQDGRVETTIEGNQLDMRVSVLPTVYGEKVVIRLLDKSGLALSIDQLGFSKENQEKLMKMLLVPEGIVLVTGPTGSGKTTTLYTILKEMNQPTKNIITVEDPVEYRLDGINQVQVNVKAGMTFPAGLRSILRQDPDIIMVGEIRDSETAEIAVRAAITGHVVLSTLHTNDTVSTIARLTDMGIPSYLVSSAVVGIIAQRLVRRICPKCGEVREATLQEKQFLGIDPSRQVSVKQGKGCNHCGGSGYKGRMAIHEVLLMDTTMKRLVSANAGEEELWHAARQGGLKTLNQNCVQLVLEGRTSVEELVRVTYSFG
ncbi:MAG: ATPase, T2SS/T4P/T4SS family [Bacillota bacterium]|nr:ATPase, T2SS/T4P/T4SS family [Bacillota bacterium]